MWTYNYELYHHGILGQKWGVRRYQNPDGTLTEEGKKRYGMYGRKRVSFDDMRNDVTEYRFRAYQQSPKLVEAKEAERQYYKNDRIPKSVSKEQIDKKEKEVIALFDRMIDLYDQAERDADEKATAYLVEKYGARRVKSYEKKYDRMVKRDGLRNRVSSKFIGIDAKIASFLDRAMGYTKHS